jgi:hypothetical protein
MVRRLVDRVHSQTKERKEEKPKVLAGTYQSQPNDLNHYHSQPSADKSKDPTRHSTPWLSLSMLGLENMLMRCKRDITHGVAMGEEDKLG